MTKQHPKTMRVLVLATYATLLPFCASCGAANSTRACPDSAETGMPEGKSGAPPDSKTAADDKCVQRAIADLAAIHRSDQLPRIETGVLQVAQLWTEKDGDCEGFNTFVTKHFVSDPIAQKAIFERFQKNVEQVSGHLHEISRYLRSPITLESGPEWPVDHLFANYNLAAHVREDFFRTKIAFVILLNFQIFTLEEKMKNGDTWTREQWARARMTDSFSARVPSGVSQGIEAAITAADTYIAKYNIHMHHLLDDDGARPFPKSLKLISHWGLRDELKSQYLNEDGLPRQKMILRVMERIIDQSIPAVVIDNPNWDWLVGSNEVKPTDSFDFDKNVYKTSAGELSSDPEPNTRYKHLLNVFRAQQAADPYFKDTATFIDRRFDKNREITESEVVGMLESVLKAPVLKGVADIVKSQLGRKLEAFDIWYSNFNSSGKESEATLDAIVEKKYPDPAAFQADIPRILRFLGFSKKDANFLGSKIVVDPSRGVGHATGALRREDNAHLRTRFGKGGMNYKGYNIAIHELGHNVEQVLSLNRIDHYLLHGVPNVAFTETFAFAFQDQDLSILGRKQKKDDTVIHLNALETMWRTFEISGVAMVDIRIWNWLYENPDSNEAQLRDAMQQVSKDVWNEFFAPVFEIRDQSVLGIYSHIVDAGLYTPDYAIGELILSTLGNHFKNNGLAKEMARTCKIGSITPGAWMKQAVGEDISANAIIANARRAVDALSK